jgi:small subunit ribosomal protein S6
MYEAIVIFRPGLSEEEQRLEFGKLEHLLKEAQAQIHNAGVFGKRLLAYEIKKCKEGLYYQINFSVEDTTVISKLKRHCSINENILRILIVKKKEQ